MTYNYDFHGILKVQSDINLRFNYFRTKEVNPDLSIQVVNEIKIDRTNAKKIGLNYIGSEDNQWLYYESTFLGFKIKFLLKNLTGKTTELLMTKPYYLARRPTTLWQDIHSFLQIKFLMKNAMLLHSACIADKTEGFLISAHADTGKTLTVLNCLKNQNFSYVSDDMLIIDSKGFAWSMPRLINFRSLYSAGYLKDQALDSFFRKTVASATSIAPYLFTYSEPIDAVDIYNAFDLRLKEKTKINKVFFLENNDVLIEAINKQDAVQRLRILNKIEFKYFPEIVYIYAYLNRFFDSEILLNQEQELLSNLLENSRSYVLRSRNPNEFAETVLKRSYE